MVTRSALPTPCFPQHRHCAPPGRRVRSGKRGIGNGSLPHPAESNWSAGRVQILEPPAPPPSQLSARSPGSCAGPGRKPRGLRAPGPEADPQAAPCWWLQLRPPAPPWRYLPCGGAERPPRATNERLRARQPPRPGEEEVPARRAWPRRRDVTRGRPQIRPRPRSLPAPAGPSSSRAV